MNFDTVDRYHLGPGDTLLAHVRKIIRGNNDVFYSYRLPWDGPELRELPEGNMLYKMLEEVAAAWTEKYPNLTSISGDSVTWVIGHGERISETETMEDCTLVYHGVKIC